MAITEQEWSKVREAVGVLMGWRGTKAKTKAATQEDISTLTTRLKAVSTLKPAAKKLAAGATNEQIIETVNLLIDDVAAISTALKKLGTG